MHMTCETYFEMHPKIWFDGWLERWIDGYHLINQV